MTECLLITGASGFLGWQVCRQAVAAGWQVIGTCHSHSDIKVPAGVCRLALDLTDTPAVDAALARVRPSAILHLAAASDPNWCQLHPVESETINVDATMALAAWCANTGTAFVFASTDLVFDGRHAPYRETDLPAPICHYGVLKKRAEDGLRERYPSATVCRLPLLFGAGVGGRKDPLGGLAQALRERRPVRLFTDEYRTPASTQAVAEGLLLALAGGARILHLAGRERVSRYEFGVRFAHWLRLPCDSIVPCLQREAAMAAPRPPDVSMDNALAVARGYTPLSLEAEFARELPQD